MNKTYWSEQIKAQTPYVAGEQPKSADLVKLNTNENPYPPSPRVLDAIREAVNADLRLYPPVPDSPGIFRGNGSDELLAMAFIAFFNGRKLYAPDVTYSFYPVWARMFGAEYLPIELNRDFTVPVERFCGVDGCVILANPNAPTGVALELRDVERIVASNAGHVVLIDESYIDFADVVSAESLVERYPNLLIVKTLSKSYSLAGLRAAYAKGSEELIAGLRVVRDCFNSYTMDRLALAGAYAALADTEYLAETCGAIIATREQTAATLREMGFDVTQSSANFVFAAHSLVPAERLYRELRDRGVLVRWWNLPRIENYLRITIGTDESMRRLIAALEEILR
ncbi:MAG: aminotransferase class I/II-fold pyridoxal phosphate-dependent enzyme [Oscillospiraceae bacterium]|jgi:histidinol-phosphate aminotransferase|nr:aminotransferase class I/II-fold pyridoxal phosphate-dependent enzyme [Oscillospiraceae bacterium]